ncbi:hypothetical protein [Paracerasibacillus soli]|uniref:Uncharacterized protein n=1 Tax=Paracerasibacillus soli TaxID=480284 RepID=A0ABU5CMW7_9BACI|nr:hypothetical protein [Virgibacillus soli]MDY0407585.1 hypothetical protein [Virgibacillus soli]
MQIKLHNINKTYKTGMESIHVLKNLHITIESGNWLTITGPSGLWKNDIITLYISY